MRLFLEVGEHALDHVRRGFRSAASPCQPNRNGELERDCDVRGDCPECGMHGLAGRHNDLVDNFEREGGCMCRARAAEGVEDEFARIVALLNRDRAEQVTHSRIDDTLDADGSFLDAQAQRSRDMRFDRPAGCLKINPESPAEKVVGVENPSTRSASVTVGRSPPRP